MKPLALILCLCSPAFAQSDADLLLLLQLKAGVTPTVAVDFDRTEAFNKLLRSQKPASKPQVAVKPAVLNGQPVAPPRVAAPISKTTAAPLNGHYEWRTRKVCKGGRCEWERYRVFVPAQASGYYPTRGNLWRVAGSDVKTHLVREHGMSAAWVATLSDMEARSAHSDCHDAGRGNAAARSRLNQYARKR